MSSIVRRWSALERWDAIARALGLFASLLILFAAVAVLLTDPSVEAGSQPYGVPSRYYLALALIAAAAVGLIGVYRGSRPLIGAAGGLILPVGLMSLLGVPAVLLIAACGVVPAPRRPSGRELVAGVLIVLLGLAPFFVPALLSSSRCWIEIEDAAGIRYELTQGFPQDPVPGQRSVTCAERVPDVAAFPISTGLVAAALGLAIRSSRRQIVPPAANAAVEDVLG
jgi:hypothetical protein